MNEIVFYLVATWLVISSVSVAFSPYPVRSVLALISAFIATAILWLGLGAEFLALALIFVYVGAVMALFLFIVFMLNIDHIKSQLSSWLRYGLIALMTLPLIWLVVKGAFVTNIHPLQPMSKVSNIQRIGTRLYEDYWVLFEYMGLILLSAMIAAIALVNRQNPHAKYQDIGAQVDKKPEDCITWMKS